MHEAFTVQKLNGLCDLQEDVQTHAPLSLRYGAAAVHPVFEVFLSAQLHLNVKIHLRRAGLEFFCSVFGEI